MPPTKEKTPSPFVSPLEKMKMFGEILTRTEFKTAFQNVVRLVRAAEQQLMARIDQKLTTIKDGHTPTKTELLTLIKPLIPKVKDGVTPNEAQLRALITPLIPAAQNGVDGVDADEEAVITKVETDLPKLGAAIRDGLELLPAGEKLNITAIEGFDEAMAGHATRILGSLGPGGGTSFSIMELGIEKTRVPIALNFKGSGAPVITHTQNGVTDLDFSNSGVSINPQIPSGTIDSSNTSFTCVGIVQVAFLDGSVDAAASITGSTNSTIVYSQPPQNSVFAL